jgi:hypothetical protein
METITAMKSRKRHNGDIGNAIACGTIARGTLTRASWVPLDILSEEAVRAEQGGNDRDPFTRPAVFFGSKPPRKPALRRWGRRSPSFGEALREETATA